ncbi:discoidin domain-containing protein [Pontiellaceae bacterium B12227]|nr:discoidin domain-containing protein [Pontiellaceae bacterium B12227]
MMSRMHGLKPVCFLMVLGLALSTGSFSWAASDWDMELQAPNGWRIPKIMGATGQVNPLTGYDYLSWYGITEHRGGYKPPFSDLPDISGITNAAAFDAASEAIRQDPLRQATASDFYIDWALFASDVQAKGIPEFHHYLFDLGIDPLLVNSKFIRGDVPITDDWEAIFKYWKSWYAMVYYFSSQYDVTMYGHRNEPHHNEGLYDVWESHWLVSADAMRKAIDDVNRDFGKSLELDFYGPTCAGAYWDYDYPNPQAGTPGYDPHGWGSVSWEKVKYDIYGNYDANNPWNYGVYDYHRYGQNAEDSENILKTLRNDIANAHNDPSSDFPIVITEYNTSTGGNFTGRGLDTEDLLFGISMAQILEASAVYGPNGLGDDGGIFVFKTGQSQGDAVYEGVGNKLGYTSSTKKNLGGITRGGACFQMYARHFRGGKPLIPVSATVGGRYGRRAMAAVDSEKQMVYIYGSVVDGYTANVTLDLSALSVDAGTVVTLQRVDAKNTGQITEFLTVNSSKELSFSSPNYTAFLLKVPMAGSVVSQWEVSPSEDTTQRVIPSGNQGSSATMKVSTHHSDAAQRNVGLLRFSADNVDTMGQALLKLSGKNTGTDPSEREILHVYAVTNEDWDENTTMNFVDAPGLGQYHIDRITLGATDGTGDMVDIEDNYAGRTSGEGKGLGLTGEFLGAVSFHSSDYVDNYLDVTDYIKSSAEGTDPVDLTFVVARIVRYNVNNYSNEYYNVGDYHYDGRMVEIATKENADSDLHPGLICYSATERSPVADWPLDDGSGTTVTDVSGNGFDGSITDAVWVDGLDGGALEFNGSSSIVTLPASAFASISNQITVAMWVYGSENQPRRDCIFEAKDASGNRCVQIILPWDSRKVYWDAGNTGDKRDRIEKLAVDSEFKGAWNHWAFTKDAASGQMKIYLNGVLSVEATGKTRTMEDITSVTLGTGQLGYYDGMIDGVKLYNVALSEEEVANLYGVPTDPEENPTRGLAAKWLFDEGAGTIASDSSGNGFDGTIDGAAWTTGVTGSALEFNGSSSLVTLPGAAFSNVTDQVTIALWVYGGTSQPRNDTTLYATDMWGARCLQILLPWGSKKIYWDAGNLGGYDRIEKTATNSDFMGDWNHWAFTKNASTGEMSIFLNGALWHTETGNIEWMSGITDVVLGAGNGYYYDGLIDDVRLYSEALSESAIAAIYDEGLTGSVVVDAAAFSGSIGVTVQTSSDQGGGEMVGFDAVGDQTSYEMTVPAAGSYLVGFRVASSSGLINLELAQNGTPLTTINRLIDAGATWTTVYKMITLQAGSSTLTVTATDGESQLLNWYDLRPSNGVFEGSVPETPENVALNQTASASSVHSAPYGPEKAFDGNMSTRWATSVLTPWLEVDLGADAFVYGVSMVEYQNRIRSYEIQVYDDGSWITAFVGGDPVDGQTEIFPAVFGSRFRLQVLSSTFNPSIYELELYGLPGQPAFMAMNADSMAFEWLNIPGAVYAVQRSTNLVSDAFLDTIEYGIPALTETNSISLELPDDPSSFYRIIAE